jgi:hypothetical protein
VSIPVVDGDGGKFELFLPAILLFLLFLPDCARTPPIHHSPPPQEVPTVIVGASRKARRIFVDGGHMYAISNTSVLVK